MTTELTVQTERVDDIPLLLAQMRQLDLSALVDRYCPTHGNWQGLSLGQVLTVWLAHILSRGDHRLNRVQEWAAQREQTLGGCLGTVVRALDFTDDRLALVLDQLSRDAQWVALEQALTGQLLRVYDLQVARVRLDSSTVSGYWQVTPEGLFQYGPSKDHRPDLPQFKVMLAALDPLGLPLVTQVLSGERADDPLYCPAVTAVRESVQRRGLLYIGDVKMGAVATRGFIAAGQDYYLCPLSRTHMPEATLATLLAPVEKEEQPLKMVYRTEADGTTTLLAQGYEYTTTLTTAVDTQTITWTERHLVIQSVAQAQAQRQTLERRLGKAEAALAALNSAKRGKKRYTTIPPVQEKVAAVLARYQVTGLLHVTYALGEHTTPKGVTYPMVKVTVARNTTALAQTQARLGWRVYATNHPAATLSLAEAVHAYRAEYLVEHNFARLKGQPLSIRPLYLTQAPRVLGLTRLLAVGLRVLTALEFGVRQSLQAQAPPLAGLYKGNPTRATARPTAERLLEAFAYIDLSVLTLKGQTYYHLTSLSEIQQRILALLDFTTEPYQALLAGLANPP